MAKTVLIHADGKGRCAWPGTDPLYLDYHDTEWGVAERDSRALFEKLMLDGFQAGLSWITILKKRDAFRKRFAGFEPTKLARWGETEIAAALKDEGIVRHRGKIEAMVKNARAYLEMKEDFSQFLWGFFDHKVFVNQWEVTSQVPAETALSRDISKALKAQGFSFCGPTIVYAFLQATGLINDHLITCFRHKECQRLSTRK